jgi:hypothetical protein
MKSESKEESWEHTVFSKLIVGAVLVGIVLILFGPLVLIWVELYSLQVVEPGRLLAATLISLGGMVSCGALIVGGIINKSIDKFVRLGMLVAAASIMLVSAMLLAIEMGMLFRIFPFD